MTGHRICLLAALLFVAAGPAAEAQVSEADFRQLQNTVVTLTGDLQRVREEFGSRQQGTERSLVERVPVGTILPYAGENLQDLERQGWMLCDGRPLASAEFPALFAAIGTAYGAPDAARFFLPDFRGRFLRGVAHDAGEDPDKETRAAPRPDGQNAGNAGNRVGSLQADQFAGHKHILRDPGHRHATTDPGHAHTVTDPGHAHAISDPGHTHGLAHRIIGDTTGGFGRIGRGTGSGSIWDIGIRATDASGTGISVQGNGTGISLGTSRTNLSVDSAPTGVTAESSGGAESRPKNVNVNWIIRVK